MKNKRICAVAATAFMVAVCISVTALYNYAHREQIRNSYAQPLEAAPYESAPTSHIKEDFIVDSGFTTHLPLVIIDTNSVEPPINTYNNGSRFVAIEGLEPYVDGTIALINGESGQNGIFDEPSARSNIKIKRRGNSSMLYEKAQWMVKLVTQSGEYNDIDLLDMGAEHEWILNGSMFDKSMLRNYLALSTASEFMPYTPDSRYCEVLIKKGSEYSYHGVYLLCESIKQGADRVNIADYKPNQNFNSYLVRRDRYDEAANTLFTYALENGLCKEYFELLYPNKKTATQNMIGYAQNDISNIEKVLYSEDEKIFSSYPNVINVDSFVDYFLLNEFFGSYDAGNYSTYFYKDKGGRLSMGPVWDYDGTMDNYTIESLNTNTFGFETKPWFDMLCRDENFITRLSRRYLQLRRESFSDEQINKKIDSVISHLGGAQQREWLRWGKWYSTQNQYSLLPYINDDGDVIERNATEYRDEIYRIKTVLREHAAAIPPLLKEHQKACSINTGIGAWNGWLLLLAAAIFLIPAVFVGLRK